MAEDGVKSRLAAILAADMVGHIANPDDALWVGWHGVEEVERGECSCRCVCNPPLRCPSAPSPSAGRAGCEEETASAGRSTQRPTISLSSSANRASLESLEVLMRSGRSLYAPQFRWHRPRRDAVPPMPRTIHWSRLAGRLLDRGRHHPFHHVARERWDARRPALLIDRTIDIFLGETLDAIDVPSAWICRAVA